MEIYKTLESVWKETPAFDIATIYLNAFYAVYPLSRTKLKKEDIISFCNMLEEELISSYGCKYVYFQFDSHSLKIFYEAYFGIFSEIGDNIFLNNQTELENLDQHNLIYNNEIQMILEKVRDIFLSQQLNKTNINQSQIKDKKEQHLMR